jgi:protein-S-isoprenylcysteine O-methyltransferase Ste14
VPRAGLDARVARLRVPLGSVLGLLCLWLARPTGFTVITGGIIALAGEALRLWAAGHLEKGREVTSSGPYRWTGHPLYVGSSIMGAGFAVAANRWLVTLIVAAYLVITLVAAVRAEETFLTSAFGEVYARYRGGEATASGRRFSWTRVRANHEYRAVLGLLGVTAVLALKGAIWRD